MIKKAERPVTPKQRELLQQIADGDEVFAEWANRSQCFVYRRRSGTLLHAVGKPMLDSLLERGYLGKAPSDFWYRKQYRLMQKAKNLLKKANDV